MSFKQVSLVTNPIDHFHVFRQVLPLLLHCTLMVFCFTSFDLIFLCELFPSSTFIVILSFALIMQATYDPILAIPDAYFQMHRQFQYIYPKLQLLRG